jgi:hypothetical protein
MLAQNFIKNRLSKYEEDDVLRKDVNDIIGKTLPMCMALIWLLFLFILMQK